MKILLLILRVVIPWLLIAASSHLFADESKEIALCTQQGMSKEAYLSKQLMGVNLLFFAEQDADRAEADYQRLIQSEGLGALRFPGGTVADNYHWATGETDNLQKYPIGHIRSDNDLSFDEFIAISKTLGAEPSLVLNYLSWVEKDRLQDGFKEAAGWVKYANQLKNYGIKYWEFGNEVYYFTAGKHINVKARTYAQDYKAMKKILRAIDANVQLGAAMPQKLDMTAKFDQGRWWDNFLDEVGNDLDYIVLHDYPPLTRDDFIAGGSSVSALLQQVREKVMAKLGRDVPVHVTEWNIAQWDKKGQRGFIERNSIWHGLFVADALLDLAVNNVRLATFWPWRTQDRFGLVSFDARRYLVGGDVFRLLAPYQNHRFLFDCQSSTLRVSRLLAQPGQEQGVLIIINRGEAQVIDLPAILGGKATIAGFTTLTGNNGQYLIKESSDDELKALSLQAGKQWPVPAGALMIMPLH